MTSLHPGRWFTQLNDRFVCELCPRRCHLKPGQRGFCFVRQATEKGIALTTYGRSSGFCVDPIEKKPLNHFLPGTPVLSFGTAGCNLGCRFCQNWDISKAQKMDKLMDTATPEGLVDAAKRTGSRSIAFTYNDPVIFAEYALDVADACREANIKTIAVTAGYISELARPEFFSKMDATNVDLKAFTESFYKSQCFGQLEPVKETIQYLVNETDVWVELTTLLIPEENDSEDEIRAMAAWIRESCSPDVPLHFSAYHPDFKLTRPATPLTTLQRARDIAMEEGLRFVYTGNVHDPTGDTTWCPQCQAAVIQRDWYEIQGYGLDSSGSCVQCGTTIPGVFDAQPGTWGRKRLPIRISR